MKKILLPLFALILVSCTVGDSGVSVVPPVVRPSNTAHVSATSTETPIPTIEPEKVINLLLLGGDYALRREGTRYGDKTDVMLLVHIVTNSDPIQIRVTQFPRNFYAPVDSFPDMWLFHVYSREGFVGLHYYFQQVFGVPLNGVAYINMDNFIRLVDDLGGLNVPVAYSSYEPMNGLETLAYLRDNDNNWGCPEYDCGNHQLDVLLALADKAKVRFHENPYVTAATFWDSYRGLVDTDVSGFDQFVILMELGWQVASSDYAISFDKLTTSGTISYSKVPLEVKGWTPTGDVKGWFHSN